MHEFWLSFSITDLVLCVCLFASLAINHWKLRFGRVFLTVEINGVVNGLPKNTLLEQVGRHVTGAIDET